MIKSKSKKAKIIEDQENQIKELKASFDLING
jgi:hypothetical protein